MSYFCRCGGDDGSMQTSRIHRQSDGSVISFTKSLQINLFPITESQYKRDLTFHFLILICTLISRWNALWVWIEFMDLLASSQTIRLIVLSQEWLAGVEDSHWMATESEAFIYSAIWSLLPIMFLRLPLLLFTWILAYIQCRWPFMNLKMTALPN